MSKPTRILTVDDSASMRALRRSKSSAFRVMRRVGFKTFNSMRTCPANFNAAASGVSLSS